ncbi:MAG: hypothetical protein FWG18_03155 [Alphaproteobacteria bacterium]|nr:hypothetical protein [Alphaproteobacteria bacterium]
MKYKKYLLLTTCYLLLVTSAHAISLSSIFGSGNNKVTDAVVAAAGSVVDIVNPEETVKKLIEKCTTPQPDGVCECVANSVLANLTPDQWKIVNKYAFDTRATVSLGDFILANPWIVPKIATPYVKCSGKS